MGFSHKNLNPKDMLGGESLITSHVKHTQVILQSLKWSKNRPSGWKWVALKLSNGIFQLNSLGLGVSQSRDDIAHFQLSHDLPPSPAAASARPAARWAARWAERWPRPAAPGPAPRALRPGGSRTWGIPRSVAGCLTQWVQGCPGDILRVRDIWEKFTDLKGLAIGRVAPIRTVQWGPRYPDMYKVGPPEFRSSLRTLWIV